MGIKDCKGNQKSNLPHLFQFVDKSAENFIELLKKTPLKTTDLNYPKDVLQTLAFCENFLTDLGAIVETVGGNKEENDSSNLPPVLFASIWTNDEYKTICIYGNIDNKGPLLCWLNALYVHKLAEVEIPVNLKFVIEITCKQYSISLANAIGRKRDFFADVEFACLAVDTKVDQEPRLKYGYRGLCEFSLTVSCGEKKVHSGTYGGAFNQPLADAIQIVGSITDKKGKIIIPEFMSDIKPITKKEEILCKNQNCDVESIKRDIGVKTLRHKNIASRLVVHKTRLPTFSVNSFNIKSKKIEIDDAASVPNKIEARFSVRLVPYQKAARTFLQFQRFIDTMWNLNKSGNVYELKMIMAFDPWLENPDSDHYRAAARAIKLVYGKCPTYVSEGKTIPSVSIFASNFPASNLIVMPISGSDNNSTGCDYKNAIKWTLAFMEEIDKLP